MLRHSKILADALPHVSRGSRPVVFSFLCAGRRYSSAGTRGGPHGTNSKNQRDHERANVGTFAAGKAALLVGASIGSGVLGYIFAQNQQTHETHDTTANALPDSPTFGSPIEFQNAISDLKPPFSNEVQYQRILKTFAYMGSQKTIIIPVRPTYIFQSN